MPYTGNLVASARYPTTEIAPGPVDGRHAAGAIQDYPDPFGGGAAPPGPDWGTPGQWVAPERDAPQQPWRPDPSSHVAATAPSLTAPRLGWVAAQQVSQSQMIDSHSARDSSTVLQQPRQPRFNFRGQGNQVAYPEGARGWEENMSGPLARGSNSYLYNNPPTEVYGGDGMRYGHDTVTFGYYRTPLPLERDYRIRAVAREEVHMPVDTPPVPNPHPFTSWSSGTQTAQPVLRGRPRLWAPPGTNSMSDATMAASRDPSGGFAYDGTM